MVLVAVEHVERSDAGEYHQHDGHKFEEYDAEIGAEFKQLVENADLGCVSPGDAVDYRS